MAWSALGGSGGDGRLGPVVEGGKVVRGDREVVCGDLVVLGDGAAVAGGVGVGGLGVSAAAGCS
jgi:hypothetical protein